MIHVNHKFFLKISALLFSLILLVFFIGVFFYQKYNAPVGKGENKYELSIEEGELSSKITRELYNQKLIHSVRFFQILLKFSGNTNKIKHGIYEVHDGLNAEDLMDIIVSGKVKMLSFTIPEGYHNRQIADLLESKKIIESKDDFYRVTTSQEILDKYKIPAKTVEGYLFPETYTIPLEYRVEKIVEMMLKRFFKNLSTIDGSKDLSPEELHKKVIMASIVEREAKKKKSSL